MKKQLVIIFIVTLLVSVGLSGCERINDSMNLVNLGTHARVGDFDILFDNLEYSKFDYATDYREAYIDCTVTNFYGKEGLRIDLDASTIEVSGGYSYSCGESTRVFSEYLLPFEKGAHSFYYTIPNNRTAVQFNFVFHQTPQDSRNVINLQLTDRDNEIQYNAEKILEKLLGFWKCDNRNFLAIFNSDGTYVTYEDAEKFTWWLTTDLSQVVIGNTPYSYVFSNDNMTFVLHNINNPETEGFFYTKQNLDNELNNISEKFFGTWMNEKTKTLSSFNSDYTLIQDDLVYDWSLKYYNLILDIGGTEYTYNFSKNFSTLNLKTYLKNTIVVYIKQ
jgi:hypothetical protein